VAQQPNTPNNIMTRFVGATLVIAHKCEMKWRLYLRVNVGRVAHAQNAKPTSWVILPLLPLAFPLLPFFWWQTDFDRHNRTDVLHQLFDDLQYE